jgi:hypothetical protein
LGSQRRLGRLEPDVGVLALRQPGLPHVLERSLSRGAIVATCAKEARVLGRPNAPVGEDPLLFGPIGGVDKTGPGAYDGPG